MTLYSLCSKRTAANVVLLAARLVVDDGVAARFELALGHGRHLGRGDEAFRGVGRHFFRPLDFSPVKIQIFVSGFGTYDGLGTGTDGIQRFKINTETAIITRRATKVAAAKRFARKPVLTREASLLVESSLFSSSVIRL